MKFLTSLLALALTACAFAAPQSLNIRHTSRVVDDLKKKVDEAGGCNVNVCFGLDGSGSLTAADYTTEKNFVLDVISIIAGNQFEVAAVQYGLENRVISPITADTKAFSLAMDNSVFAQATATFISGGILYCHGQLRRRPDEAHKIVIIGDGGSNFGGDPLPRANRFRATGGKICTVGIGFQDTQMLLDIAGGDPSMVLTVDDYFELTDILGELVQQICGIPLV